MTYASKFSPVGWYVGTYRSRFVELAWTNKEDPEQRFLVWDNTVIVKADSPEEAYDKVEALGRDHAEPYKGGEEGVDVQWVYEGVVELLPIYEDLKDGAEIMWAKSNKKLKNIRSNVKSKEEWLAG